MTQFITATCLLLVDHFLNIKSNPTGYGFNSRVFSYVLHPEEKFILEGYSAGAIAGKPSRLEHLVPCIVLYNETQRLLANEKLSKAEIALLLQKHWRVARITQEEQKRLDSKHKQTMPEGWIYETGDTLARLKAVGIEIEIELQPPPL